MPRSCVSVRCARVRTGAVRLARSGLRLVPENLAMMMCLLPGGLGLLVLVGLGNAGQGTGWREQRRIERLALRPLLPKEVRPVPSQLTGEKVSARVPGAAEGLAQCSTN